MKNRVLFAILLVISNYLVLGFTAPRLTASREKQLTASISAPTTLSPNNADEDSHDAKHAAGVTDAMLEKMLMIPAIMVLTTAAPAEAATPVVPAALWAYAHYLSIICITGCLAAERTIVKANMTVNDEDTVVKLDLVYGLMAALLIGSGFARATNFGQGSEYYIHETIFWIKMSLSGIWGGLSLFPSITFYKRNFARKNDETVPPVSEALAIRLQQVINAEILAILSIPFLATLMARGVWYSQDFPWPAGLATAILATCGSFYFYARQALTWTEDEAVLVEKE